MDAVNVNSRVNQSQNYLKPEKTNPVRNNLSNLQKPSKENRVIPAVIDFGLILTPLLLLHKKALGPLKTIAFVALAGLFPSTHTLNGVQTPGVYIYSRIKGLFSNKEPKRIDKKL